MIVLLVSRKAWSKKFLVQLSLVWKLYLLMLNKMKGRGKAKLKILGRRQLNKATILKELQTDGEVGGKNFPDTTKENVEKYLDDKAPKALLKGSSLEKSGHLTDCQCHNISSNVWDCFVSGKVIPQECTNNAPYELWVLLNKEGPVVTGGCLCGFG